MKVCVMVRDGVAILNIFSSKTCCRVAGQSTSILPFEPVPNRWSIPSTEAAATECCSALAWWAAGMRLGADPEPHLTQLSKYSHTYIRLDQMQERQWTCKSAWRASSMNKQAYV